MATELATAYVALVPSLKGAQKEIESQLSGINLSGAGKAMGSSITSGISSSMSTVGNAVSKAGNLFSSTFGTAAKVGVGAITGIGTAVVGLAAKGGLTRALNLEQAQTMFKGLKLQWSDYEQTINDAVDGTAFSLDSAALVAAQLAASGVGAGKQMETALNACVGAAATFGRDLGDIGSVFQKVAAKGKLSGDELMQLNERGINAVSVLSEYLGKTQDEVSQMVSKGQIDFETFSNAMYAAFGDSAQAANETFTGSMANMRSALNRIGADFMTPFKDAAIPVFNAVREALNEVKKALKPLSDRFGELAERVSGKLVTGLSVFTDYLKSGRSIAEAAQRTIDGLFGAGTTQNILGLVSALGGLAALGPVLKIAGAGISVASGAISGLSKVSGMLTTAASSVGGFISRIGGSSISAITTFGKSLMYGLVPQGVFDKVRSLGSDLSYGLADCRRDLSNAFAGIKESIASKFEGIGEAINAKLGGIPGKVGSVVSNLKTTITESLGNAADAFRAKFNIGDHANGETSKLSAAFSKIKSAAGTIGGPLLTAAAGLTAVAGGLLVAGVAAVAAGVDVEGACNQFLTNIQSITANLPVMAQQFAGILPSLVNQVVAAIPALVQAFSTAMMSLVQVFPVILPVLVQGLTDLVMQLAPVLITFIPLLLDAGMQLFTSLINALSSILPILIEQIPVMVEQLSVVLVANLPLLLEAGLTLFMSLTQAFIQMLPQLIGMLPSLISQVVDMLISFAPQLLSTAGQLFMMIVKAVPQILSSLLAAVGSVLGQIPGKITSFAGRMGDAAYQMLLGMIRGIQDAAGAVWNKITEVCSGALDAVKNFFGIASPSKLMRKMFRFVGQGAALGLGDTADVVADEMQSLIEGVAREAGAMPSIPIAISAEPPETMALGRKLELERELSDSASASAIDRMNENLHIQNGSQIRTIENATNRLASILEAIYEVIPDQESEWDFQRRVRRAVNG